MAAAGLSRARSLWEAWGRRGAIRGRAELLGKLNLAAGWDLEACSSRKAVGPFGWDLKLKRLQNLAADQRPGMR